MPKIFCISDIHGHLDALEEALSRIKAKAFECDRLILLGDYIDNGPDSGGVLRRVFELQKTYGSERVIVLRGNHEEMLLEWLDIFAGPPERTYVWKFPATFGRFSKDIIAGHIGTASLSGDRNFHDIFWDGASHYFCDGTVCVSGKLPVLMYDTQTGEYYSLGEGEPRPIQVIKRRNQYE